MSVAEKQKTRLVSAGPSMPPPGDGPSLPALPYEVEAALADAERSLDRLRSAVVAVTGAKPALLTVDQTAFRLGVVRRTVYQMIADGVLASTKIARARRIPVTEVERLAAIRPPRP